MGAALSTRAASRVGIRVEGVGTSTAGIPIVVPAGSRCRSSTRMTSCAQSTCSISLLVSKLGSVSVSPSVVGRAAVEGGATADVVDVEEFTDDEDGRGMRDMSGDAIWSGIIGLGRERLGVGSAGADSEMGKLGLVSILCSRGER